MIQVGLRLRQGHPLGRNGRDNFSVRTANALRIRELFQQPATECAQNILFSLCGIYFFAQKRLTLREFNSLIHQDSTKIILRNRQSECFRFVIFTRF